MSLYREAGQNTRQGLIAGAIALVIGLGAGYLIGQSNTEDPSLADSIGALRSDLTPISNGLELLGGEYPQAVKNGEIVAQTEYDGSVSNVQRIADTLAANRTDLEQLDPAATAQLESDINDLLEAVQLTASVEEIDKLRTQAATELESILPSESGSQP